MTYGRIYTTLCNCLCDLARAQKDERFIVVFVVFTLLLDNECMQYNSTFSIP